MSATEKVLGCFTPVVSPLAIEAGAHLNRVSAIRSAAKLWPNGSVIRYFLYNETDLDASILELHEAVEYAFKKWEQKGIGLTFKRTLRKEWSEVRITFVHGRNWCAVGRDCLKYGVDEQTMNIGQAIRKDSAEFHIALHDVGHVLGMEHEHQNPYANFKWNEGAVYAYYSDTWDRETIHYNILRRTEPRQLRNIRWDINSVMHFPIPPGLLAFPIEDDQSRALNPRCELSDGDTEYARKYYPPRATTDSELLEPFASYRLDLENGEQKEFFISVGRNREYTIEAVGSSADVYLTLFEVCKTNTNHLFLAGDDDSGTSRNARIHTRLFAKRPYILRCRLVYAASRGEVALTLH